MVTIAELAEALFQLAESHPAGDLRLALLRTAYAVFDHPRELSETRRLPEAAALEVVPALAMLRSCRTADALWAAAHRLAGPNRLRSNPARDGFLTAAEARGALASGDGLDHRRLRGCVHWHTRASPRPRCGVLSCGHASTSAR